MTVTLSWEVHNNDGSGGRGLVYRETPQITAVFEDVRRDNADINIVDAVDSLTDADLSDSTAKAEIRGKLMSCNRLSDADGPSRYLDADFYSFKFISEPSAIKSSASMLEQFIANGFINGLIETIVDTTTVEITKVETTTTTTTTKATIEVKIPAGGRKTTFRFDPHRCPDSTTIQVQRDHFGPSSYTVSVSIDSNSAYTSDGTSKELEVKFLYTDVNDEDMDGDTDDVFGNKLKATIGGKTFKEAIESAFLRTFKFNQQIADPNLMIGINDDLSDHLADITGKNVFVGDSSSREAYGLVDKISGQYGSDE